MLVLLRSTAQLSTKMNKSSLARRIYRLRFEREEVRSAGSIKSWWMCDIERSLGWCPDLSCLLFFEPFLPVDGGRLVEN